jgi:hypothetical protein
MTIESKIKELNPFLTHRNEQIAEYAQTITNYAMALKEGKLSRDEYNSLTGDLAILQRMAQTADEQTQVAQIYAVSRLIISLL